MAYTCQYVVGDGANCKAWAQSDVPYCDEHQKTMDDIDVLEKEILKIVTKAREKKSRGQS